jgi:hypothetical protein
LACACVLAAIAAADARAGQTPVGLPSPSQQLTASPPLTGSSTAAEFRVPGRVDSRQEVSVGIGPDGAPVSVRDIERLVLNGKGDYSFIVPGPLTDVLPGPGTDSQPGFRTDAIVWQGFSPGRRVLAADARLRPKDAAASLPVRLSLRTTVAGKELEPGERGSGQLILELTAENVTATPVVTFTAAGVPRELAVVLDSLRNTIAHGDAYNSYVANIGSKPEPLTRRFGALVELQGSIAFPHGRVEALRATGARVAGGHVVFSGRLGEDDPTRLTVRVTGRASDLGAPILNMRVTPDLELHALRPPQGSTWKQAIGKGLVRPDPRAFLSDTIAALLRTSRTRQYEAFLANPDPYLRAGADRTVYRYRTVAAVRAVSPVTTAGGGHGTLFAVLVALGGAAIASGLLVVWARS